MRRKLIVTGALILSIALLLTGAYKLMNLRNYQVFGDLINSDERKGSSPYF